MSTTAERRFEKYRDSLREVMLEVMDGENATEDNCADEVAEMAIKLADAESVVKQRLHQDVVEEYRMAAESWDAQRDRLKAEIGNLRGKVYGEQGK